MTNSKIHKDEVDWLIVIACSSDIAELKDEAIDKLKEYGLIQEQIEERYKNIDSKEAQEKAFKKQHERNEFEAYTTNEKMKIFFFGPYELFKNYNSGLRDLYRFNYKTKFREKLIFLIAGTLFWLFTGIFVLYVQIYK